MKKGERYIVIQDIPSRHLIKTWKVNLIPVGTVFTVISIDKQHGLVRLSDADRKSTEEHFVTMPMDEFGSRLKPYGAGYVPSKTEMDVLQRIRNCKDWNWVGIFEAMIIRQCVQKQVKRKPCFTSDNYFSYTICPMCKNRVATNYCPECGQKIDWGKDK